MTDFPWYLGLPLLCSVIYVTSVMMLKFFTRYPRQHLAYLVHHESFSGSVQHYIFIYSFRA